MVDINNSSWIQWVKEFKKKKLTETLEVTLNLFKEGLDINHIAKRREYKEPTVEKQIIELIAKGFIHIEDVLSKEKIDHISKVLDDENISSLTMLKEILGEDYSYFEIKSYLASLAQVPEKK